ncbi:BlaI/MecI/CopY family transcriptional regulator [Sulfuriroseicoccus oceanibius]|uniref:BlaI/MecI/CopY family transcriptional regulator n=1 Tax=Sulfuriroseicoccus oceanibius TaxID=2707525 RepID=A0A6B3L448_9BACT|nr:BlaI/MecI/CopY family transcriptional regulator [Sulfuriroseicoccus oceanibius]QQL45505.1 BlaI/MecI/CopY family transcriptional regulator [Sulfuriroseicoccus oceanibius]
MAKTSKKPDFENLSRREREVMYVVHQHGRVSAEMVQSDLPNEISYSGARRYLSILEEKGFLTMEKEGARYFYSPVADTTEVGLGLLKKAFGAFFNGSPVMGIANFVQREGSKMDARELAYLEKLIQDAKEQGQ